MFKVGDRVEATKDSQFANYKKGDKGTVMEVSGQISSQPVRVVMDNGKDIWPIAGYIKLVTEEPMNVITALQQSITHWQEIVSVFGGAKVSDGLHTPNFTADTCPLCTFFREAKNPANCDDCPLDDCNTSGSTWMGVYTARSNLDAFFASKAMLARLEELLVEEQAKAKKEEDSVQVGDMVALKRPLIKRAGVDLRESVFEVLAIKPKHFLTLRGYSGNVWDDHSTMVTVYRPTKEAK